MWTIFDFKSLAQKKMKTMRYIPFMLKKASHLLFIGSLLFIVNMAGSEPAPMPDSRDMDAKQFYFEMDSQTRKAFISKVHSIKVGDSAEHVKSILGEPTYDKKIASKETNDIKGRILIYYIKRWKKNLVNEKYDSLVQLIFDNKNKLIDIKSKIDVK